MSNRIWMFASLLVAALATGCCHDQCGYYNSTAYDPCTGLVQNSHGCLGKIKNIFHKDDGCGCKQKKQKSQCGCGNDHMMPSHGSHVYGGGSSDCPCNDSHSYPGTPTFSPSGPMETYVSPEEFDKIEGTPMPSKTLKTETVPTPMQPMKPVPAPAAEPEALPSETSTTIPPASYVVPSPLEGPSVPVLKPFQG